MPAVMKYLSLNYKDRYKIEMQLKLLMIYCMKYPYPYPYTKISGDEAEMVYNILILFGYEPEYFNFEILGLRNRFKQYNELFVVLDDCRDFGIFCFYTKKGFDEYSIKRKFIKDKFEFLKFAAYLKTL